MTLERYVDLQKFELLDRWAQIRASTRNNATVNSLVVNLINQDSKNNTQDTGLTNLRTGSKLLGAESSHSTNNDKYTAKIL